MSVNVGTAVGYLDLDTSKFSKGFSSALADLKGFGDASLGIGGSITALGDSLVTVGTSLNKNVTLPIAALGVGVVKTAADFESAMSNVKAISGATGEEFDLLRQKAIELGADTVFSASEAADAMKFMAQAGWDTNDILNGLAGVMDLAAASGVDFATTAEIVADTMSAFGLEADQSARFADILAQTANKTSTGVLEMGESFKYIAPLAGAMGYSVEDVSVALGIMANQGIKGSQAGTALRGTLTNLAKPTSKMEEAMEKLGISLTDSEGNMKSLDTVMNDLRSAFDGLSEAEKIQYAATLAGKEGMSGLLAIVNTAPEAFEDVRSGIYDSSGAAQEMADIMTDNLGGSIEELKGALETMAITFGDILLPFVRQATDFLKELAEKINNLTDEQKEQIVQALAMAAALGPILTIVGKILIPIGKLISLFAQLGGGGSAASAALAGVGGAGTTAAGGIAAVAAGIGTVVGVLAVLAAIVATTIEAWQENWGGFRDKIQEGIDYFTTEIGPAWESIKESVTKAIEAIKTLAIETWEKIKTAWETDFMGIKTIVENFFSSLGTMVETALKVIADLVALIAALLRGDWEEAWERAKKIVSDVLDGIKEIFTDVWESIKAYAQGIYDEIWAPIVEKINEFVESVKEKFNEIKEGIVEKFEEIKTSISEWFDSVIKWFEELPSTIAAWLINTTVAIAEWVGEAKETMVTGIEEAIEAVKKFFEDLPYNIGYALGYAIETIRQWCVDTYEEMSTKVSEAIDKVVEFFSELPGRIKTWFDDAFTKTKTWLAETYETMSAKIKETVDKVIDWFREMPGRVKQWLDDLMTKFKTWVSDTKEKLSAGAKEAVDSVVKFFSELPGKVKQWLDDTIQKIKQWVTDTVDNAKKAGKDFIQEVESAMKDLPGTFKKWFDEAKAFLNRLPEELKTIGKNILNGLWDGLKSVWDSISSWFSGIVSQVSSFLAGITSGMSEAKSKASGSHAMGLDYVPFDGYTAVMHEGERILTKEENKSYNANSSSGGMGGANTQIVINSPSPLNPAETARQLRQVATELALGF